MFFVQLEYSHRLAREHTKKLQYSEWNNGLEDDVDDRFPETFLLNKAQIL